MLKKSTSPLGSRGDSLLSIEEAPARLVRFTGSDAQGETLVSCREPVVAGLACQRTPATAVPDAAAVHPCTKSRTSLRYLYLTFVE